MILQKNNTNQYKVYFGKNKFDSLTMLEIRKIVKFCLIVLAFTLSCIWFLMSTQYPWFVTVHKVSSNSSGYYFATTYYDIFGNFIGEGMEGFYPNRNSLLNFLGWIYFIGFILSLICVLFTYEMRGLEKIGFIPLILMIIGLILHIIGFGVRNILFDAEFNIFISELFKNNIQQAIDVSYEYKEGIYFGFCSIMLNFLGCSYITFDIFKDVYGNKQKIFYNQPFMIKFIKKAMKKTESKLWDFKQTLSMWNGGKNKKKSQIKFCESVAGFANAEGGILIIGITNKIPRKIIGLNDLENKKQSLKTTIRKFIDYRKEFYILNEIIIKNEQDSEQTCLILAITQTKNHIGVRQKDKKKDKFYYSFPIRLETGIVCEDYTILQENKSIIYQDNYKFVDKIKKFCK